MSAIAMTILLATGLSIFTWSMLRRWRLMRVAAAPADRSGDAGRRWGQVLEYLFGQARMFRYPAAGVAHAMIFGGFVIVSLRTIILAVRAYTGGPQSTFGFWLFDDDAVLGVAYSFLKDVINVLVIAGVLYFAYLRLFRKPRRMTLGPEGIAILAMIFGLMVADLLYEATGFVRGGPPRLHGSAMAASLVSFGLSAVPPGIVNGLNVLAFWAHTILVITFLNFLPFGKHFHILTIGPQVYFSNPQPNGRLEPIPDIEGRIERSETLGIKTAADLSWKGVLDLYTCTECGRCSDHCPATRTGKLLSPKHLTLDLRDHMYRNEAALLNRFGMHGPARQSPAGPEPLADEGAGAGAITAGAGPAGTSATSTGADGNGHSAVPAFIRKDGAVDESGGELVGSWIEPEVLWACTTCGACEQECPVFISYIDKIVGMRRNLVQERGEFPAQLQNAFRGLESAGNVYSFDNGQRGDWAAGLNIPTLAEKPGAAVLYWVGCSPSFDDRARRIARAFATLMQRAGVDFAILGAEETCTGDPARRAGNEYLFEMLAKSNVDTLTRYAVRKIVTTCPHCFNTHRNEYPDFGARYEVVHHTEFLAQLVRDGKLHPARPVGGQVAYHDACYLGRHNGVYDAPRELARAIPGLELVEPVQSRDRGMCCGAGGAQMWKEEEHSYPERGGERTGKVNHERARQLLRVLPPAPAAAGASATPAGASGSTRTIATACPFCMTMLTDAVRDQGHTDVQTLDIAELLLQSLEPAAQ